MSKEAVKHIIETLGADAICEKLNVGSHAVRYAKTSGMFPSAWYAGLLDLCNEAHLGCPLEAFNWKGQTEAGAA